jgi:hypothetical protein
VRRGLHRRRSGNNRPGRNDRAAQRQEGTKRNRGILQDSLDKHDRQMFLLERMVSAMEKRNDSKK